MHPTAELDRHCINAIRALSMDGVQAANSGHPGLPLGAAPMAHALWSRHLRFNPANPAWFHRDRFILSAGHGSMLLYSLLHLTGFDLSLEELQSFRQWGSKTPGHPENHLTPGVEMATGPLGQGISHAVGMAIAERWLAATYNRPGHAVIDHRTYVICSDGDLMEGISNEAGSLAGHLQLGKLIALYDDNGITIDGSTKLAFTEHVGARYAALGWHVQHVDGMDVHAVDEAIKLAKANEQPSLILCKTVIGFGSPNKAGSPKAHGAPLGPSEVDLTKEALGIPTEPKFYVSPEAREFFAQFLQRGAALEATSTEVMAAYAAEFPVEAAELSRAMNGDLPEGWEQALPVLGEKIATRAASRQVLQKLADAVPNLVGGSADLAESNFTWIESSEAFQAASPAGRNLCFGVREHAMAAAVNGMNLHGGVRAYGATFLIFSDYCRPALRLAALMQCPSIFVFTHDSIGLGEDGPTHQPIEQVASLRAIPNLNLMRPADGHETAVCWAVALGSRSTPCAIALTRQALPSITPSDLAAHPARRGAYVLAEASTGEPARILVATGSEVHLALAARDILEAEGLPTRVVSMPSWFLFEAQAPEYRSEVLPGNVVTVSVEAGSTFGWARYAHRHVGLDRFGASAPAEVLFREFGFTAENIAATAR